MTFLFTDIEGSTQLWEASLPDAETFDRAWSEGQAMTYEPAIEFALAEAGALSVAGPSDDSPGSPTPGEILLSLKEPPCRCAPV